MQVCGWHLLSHASNEASCQVELANIQGWANRNNLRLNCSKSCEVIFSDSRRRGRSVPEPAPLPGITRSRCLKVLGVNIASDFSVSQHIQRLVTASAQIVYALRLLRSRGPMWHCSPARLQINCHSAADGRRQCVARSRQHVWSPTYRLGDRPCPPKRVLRVRPTIFWWTMWLSLLWLSDVCACSITQDFYINFIK